MNELELKDWIRKNLTIRVREEHGYYTRSINVQLCFSDPENPCAYNDVEVIAEDSFPIPNE